MIREADRFFCEKFTAYFIFVVMTMQPFPLSQTTAPVENGEHPFPLAIGNPRARPLACLIAILAWITLAAQTSMTIGRIVGRGMTVLDGLGRTTSYLTNLTVLLCALCFSALALAPRARSARRWPMAFLRKPPVVSAIVVYMAFVGVAYNALLRHLWTPTGTRELVNELLHSVLPFLAAAYWAFFVPRFHLHVRQFGWWLAYPLGYLMVTLWRGGRSGFYPYPFIDVQHLGFLPVLRNSAMLLLAFLILMGLFMTINHRRKPTL